jgi:hypothetical protein
MIAKFLDHKLDCKNCGMIRLDVPASDDPRAPVACIKCGTVLGTWGEIKADFFRQTSAQAFYLNEGKIREVPSRQPGFTAPRRQS